MIIKEALKLAISEFNKKNINCPALEAEILLSHILKKTREFLLTHPNKKISQNQIVKFKDLAGRRKKGEPIAYLIGSKEFYGLDFIVNKNTLIPRPETESMVEETMNLISQISYRKSRAKECITLIDVGTGSGCIVITLAKLLKLRITNYELFAIDISKQALTIAKKNAKLHKVGKKIKFLQGNLLEPILKNKKLKIKNQKLMILSNLPYGWKEWKNNCSMETVGLKFEPAIALFTEKNGLKLYEDLFKQVNELVKFKPLSLDLLCEFDPRQTSLMKELIKKYFPQAKLQIKKDLAGRNRLAIIKV